MNSEFSTQRSTTERVVIGFLIVLGTLLLLGIQSLFLNHIASALPADDMWRVITVGCFLAPPFAFAFLVILKMNFSRSAAQDYILFGGMALELILFVINLIVAVNAQTIQGTMLGVIGVLLGGVAGVVSAGTTAFTLAADPLRALAKAQVQHDLAMEKAAQTKTRTLFEQAMESDGVKRAGETFAESHVTARLERAFGHRVNDPRQPSLPQPNQPGAQTFHNAMPTPQFQTTPAPSAAPPSQRDRYWILRLHGDPSQDDYREIASPQGFWHINGDVLECDFAGANGPSAIQAARVYYASMLKPSGARAPSNIPAAEPTSPPPGASGTVSERWQSMLQMLGYSEDAIRQMTPEQAESILRQALERIKSAQANGGAYQAPKP